mmetsp:Transcript_137144/g.437611  ORF Transcript_137144/g.437611 Transcript_137144/m.437611 type:complete len:135 (-) Transcript_137144:13-417(-)
MRCELHGRACVALLFNFCLPIEAIFERMLRSDATRDTQESALLPTPPPFHEDHLCEKFSFQGPWQRHFSGVEMLPSEKCCVGTSHQDFFAFLGGGTLTFLRCTVFRLIPDEARHDGIGGYKVLLEKRTSTLSTQ